MRLWIGTSSCLAALATLSACSGPSDGSLSESGTSGEPSSQSDLPSESTEPTNPTGNDDPDLGSESESGTDSDSDSDSGFDPDDLPADTGAEPEPNPQTLCESGFYSDCDEQVLAPGVLEFSTAYTLWSDGAEKRRYIQIPPGTQIDSSDMDFWEYPPGTKLWKEFFRDGIRIETRLLYKKFDTGNWFSIAYAWNEEQTEAVSAPLGIQNALGTDHDIPGFNVCKTCHQQQPDIVLGFSAIMLSHDQGGVTLQSLIDNDQLTDPPINPNTPIYGVPGEGSPAQAALGYLHANCGGCHHEQSAIFNDTPLNLRLSVNSLTTVEETALYQSTVDIAPVQASAGMNAHVVPGDPSTSELHARMENRAVEAKPMPPVGTEDVDVTGIAFIDAWISSIAP